MATALFVCLHNAGRSQMSAALFERAARGRHHALSAGSIADPNDHVHPEVVEVMRELDIDLSDRRPQRLTSELAQQADIIVTMGCGDTCPYIPGKRYVDWDLQDPKGPPDRRGSHHPRRHRRRHPAAHRRTRPRRGHSQPSCPHTNRFRLGDRP